MVVCYDLVVLFMCWCMLCSIRWCSLCADMTTSTVISYNSLLIRFYKSQEEDSSTPKPT
jgi:hypothetical protein